MRMQLITKKWVYKFISDDCIVIGEIDRAINLRVLKPTFEQVVNWRIKYENRYCIKIIYVNNTAMYVYLGDHFCWTNNIL